VILIPALCGSLLCCIAAVALAVQRAPASALPFRIASRRTRIAAGGCLAIVLAVVVGSLVWAPRSQTQPVTLGAGTSMVVVDLSGSIGPLQYSTIHTTLAALGAQPNRHVGLVFFSDSATEVLPPATPASELAAVTRFFVRDPRDPILSTGETLKANPWMNAFAGGTAIFRGLNLARRALEQAHARHGQIVLISDLADNRDPRTRTALLRIAASKLQLRVVGLDPTEDSKRMYLNVFGQRVFVANPTLATSVQADRPERATGTRTLIPAAMLAILLLALFAWWQTPLQLRMAER
jgi:hypothetical protein